MESMAAIAWHKENDLESDTNCMILVMAFNFGKS